MNIRRALWYGAAALLGVATVALPAQAGSETTPSVPAIVAQNVGLYHQWTPPEAAVEPGGTVEFSNPTEVPHGVRWVSTPAGQTPECGAGVPVGATEAASGKNWSGSCSFAAAGVYVFYCTVHGAAMTGRVDVGSTTTTGTTTSTTTPSGPGTGVPQPGEAPAPGASGGGAGPPATSAVSALRLRPSPHGATLRGSVEVSREGAGGRLEIDLIASRGALAATAGAAGVRVGRLLRDPVSAGLTHFAIAVGGRARGALRAHGRLALTVRVLLRPRRGAAASITRRVTLRR